MYPVFSGALKMWTTPSEDAEEVGTEDEEKDDEEDEEEGEDVTRGSTLMGTLCVGRLKTLTVPDASVLEDVDSEDEELLLVETGTGSPLDKTLPHGSSPKTWPDQPQCERQESTQPAPPHLTCFFDSCCLGSLEPLLPP
jgi:hypothetical protein